MKNIVNFCFLTLILNLQLPDSFAQTKLAGYLEVISKDSLKIYHNGFRLSHQNCATHYRLAKLDSLHFCYTGDAKDYFMNGNLASEGLFDNGLKKGVFKYYHSNQKLKEIGKFSVFSLKINNRDTLLSLRDSLWIKYYESGKVENVIFYKNTQAYLIEARDSLGNFMVKEGSGIYKANIRNSFVNSTQSLVIGEINKGIQNGKWLQYIQNKLIASEEYNQGIFLKGVSYSEKLGQSNYSEPQITFEGINHIEYLDILSTPQCTNISSDETTLNELMINIDVEKKIIGRLQKFISKQKIKNAWLIVCYILDKNNQVISFQSYSPNQILNEDKLIELFKELGFFKLRKESPSNKQFAYLPLIIENGKIMK